MINALQAVPLAPTPSSPVILMVSGGSDSTALLVRAVLGELDLFDGQGPQKVDPSRLVVLHVNHCLRGEASDGDEAFVRELGKRLGVAVHVLRADVPGMLAAGGNMEQTAREVRYGAAWDLAGEAAGRRGVARETSRILVAHTADDRVETFLMRATEGAGTSGLTGMRPTRGIVVRPLLGETRAALRAYLADRGIGWREDATNAEDAALRSYIRNRVVPALVERNPRLHESVGRMLDVMADEDRLLEGLAARTLKKALRPSRAGTLALDVRVLSEEDPAIVRRALRCGLRRLLGEEGFLDGRFEGRHVEALLRLVRARAGSCSLPRALDARIDRGELVISTSTSTISSPLTKPLVFLSDTADDRVFFQGCPAHVKTAVRWGEYVVRARLVPVPPSSDGVVYARDEACRLERDEGLTEGRDFVLVDAAAVGLGRGAVLEVGGPRTGERMRPLGMAGSKLVSDVLSDAHVPVRDRRWTPVVRTNDAVYGEGTGSGVVWVGGIRLDGRAAYRPETRALVELTFWKPASGGDGAVPHE